MLSPRYDGPPILSIDGPPIEQVVPFTRQRRRLLSMLAALTDQQWAQPSRCAGWTVRDVAAHLASVDGFWHSSIKAGLKGSPSQWLPGFDPAATPPLLVDQMHALGAAEVLQQLVSVTEPLLRTVTALTDEQCSMMAEAPPGHVPISVLLQHALWDCWIHERDIAVPLGVDTPVEADEVRSSLHYAAAIGPALAIGLGRASSATLAIEATDPDVRFVIEIDHSVRVREQSGSSLPCLRGDAVELTEALSLRTPMPSSAPAEWTALTAGLAVAFS